MEKIDFVILWTDENNKEWSDIRKQYMPRQEDKEDSHAPARFRDMGTLKYVMRSIEQHCPWYHRIYLITKGYHPEWLNIDHPKVMLVNESELFEDKSCLPVFNSIAIEMNLHNIPNLSEKFVYLNDDMLIMRPLQPERFFKEGKSVDFLSHSFLARNVFFDIFKKRDTWVHSINNSIDLINKHFAPIQLSGAYLYHSSYSTVDKINNFLFDKVFKKFIWLAHWHHPQPHLKRTLLETYESFSEEMKKCSCSRFRDMKDLNPYIYRYYHLAKGDFYPYKYNDAIVSNLNSLKTLNDLLEEIDNKKEINFVCFNDSTELSEKEYRTVKTKLTAYLQQNFPIKASFEKG